ncbi:hypothetical protein [Staphylococcus equorum]|uniref:hypothetical protein n=1 Tax=Staphylococcus equorum TaxID=246432 RepID=UPI00192CF4E3|nr:hypothetical protein [Staphylococcus equorum]
MSYSDYVTKAFELAMCLWKCRTVEGRETTDVDRVCNAEIVECWFFNNTSRVLPNDIKDILTDYLLYRGLKSGKESSYFRDEYPYQTETQLTKRQIRETSLEFAQNHDTLSRSRSQKTRTNRIEIEEALNVKRWRLNESQVGCAKGV